MDRMLYIATVGAQQSMRSQAVNANNLANVSTTGFRRDLDAFTSTPVEGAGHASRVYGVDRSTGFDPAGGAIVQTGNPLDVAIADEGWLTVQAPDGTEAYTRAGNLRVDSSGLLTNDAGHPVMGNGGPITLPPYEKLEIGSDGTISIRPAGAADGALVQIDRLRLVNPDPAALAKGEDGLMRTTADQAPPPDAGVAVTSGALESSNVSAVDAMVRQIELARQFEMQMKVMSTARDVDSAADQLLRHG